MVAAVLYYLSKAFWLVFQPGNLLVLLLALGSLLSFTRWRRSGRVLVTLVALLMIATAILPVGRWLLEPLEDRFPILTELPAKVDGVIMLGGAVSTVLTDARGQPQVNEHAERFLAFADLARRYPNAKLVFTGGGAMLQGGAFREADASRKVMAWLGMDVDRVIFERESRNTYENVVNSKVLVRPAPGEVWLLVTSAFHMPRAVGIFRAQDWPVVAYPVDYQTGAGPDDPAYSADFLQNLGQSSLAIKEWISLLANQWLGHSDALFPAPRP
jgi:uncharacterized SAM-binding protein YcdF (DUF218 family)